MNETDLVEVALEREIDALRKFQANSGSVETKDWRWQLMRNAHRRLHPDWSRADMEGTRDERRQQFKSDWAWHGVCVYLDRQTALAHLRQGDREAARLIARRTCDALASEYAPCYALVSPVTPVPPPAEGDEAHGLALSDAGWDMECEDGDASLGGRVPTIQPMSSPAGMTFYDSWRQRLPDLNAGMDE